MSVLVDFGSALALMFVGLAVFVIGVHFVFFPRQRGLLPGGRPSYSGLRSAYLNLQNLAQPEKQYVLDEIEKDEKHEDDEGGPDVPTRYRQRKARD